MDNRPLYLATAEAFLGLVRRIPADAWATAGLGIWDVRSLVGHTTRALTTVSEYVVKPADSIACQSAADYWISALGGADQAVHDAVAQRGVAAGEALGADPAVAVEATLSTVREQLASLDNPVITTIAGGMRLQDYLGTRVLELTVHTLDLADATGIAVELPPAALELTLGILTQVALANGRSGEVIRLLTGRGGSPFTLT